MTEFGVRRFEDSCFFLQTYLCRLCSLLRYIGHFRFLCLLRWLSLARKTPSIRSNRWLLKNNTNALLRRGLGWNVKAKHQNAYNNY